MMYNHEKGYLLAKVTDVFFVQSLRALLFNVEEGMVDDVRFEGLENMDPNILLRQLKIRANTVFKVEDIVDDQGKIEATGFFSKVSKPRLMPSDKTVGKFQLIYTVDERKINNVQVGLEQLQNNKFGGTFSVKLPNFRNTGESLLYLECGIYENGFARVRCGDCKSDNSAG